MANKLSLLFTVYNNKIILIVFQRCSFIFSNYGCIKFVSLFYTFFMIYFDSKHGICIYNTVTSLTIFCIILIKQVLFEMKYKFEWKEQK